MSTALRVGIVGCGLIGRKRAGALAGASLTLSTDVVPERARELAASRGAKVVASWQELVQSPEVDLVIVATPNDQLAPIAAAAIAAGKHVMLEKPAGRTAAEVKQLLDLARKHRRKVRVGFNHRYHPAFLEARRIIDSGVAGELMFIRARYGHGGRVGYEKEWRANPKLSGGGELIDQGVHLIDLSRWFLGDFPEVLGRADTYFWDMPVDDNAFMLLRDRTGRSAFLQVSCTEWKNMFSFEIYGRTAKLVIEGLGGSYGVERLYHYQMKPEMGPPDTVIHEYPRGDDSWRLEFAEFLEDIRLDREPAAGLDAALAALTVVESVYAQSGRNYA